jgi:hypothetical protein
MCSSVTGFMVIDFYSGRRKEAIAREDDRTSHQKQD